MISIGFQFDYELNSKNHSKKIIKHFGFFSIFFDFFGFFSICFWLFWDFFGLFWIFSISIGFQLVFFWKLIFFDFFGFFSISIGFQLDFFGFQLDFNWIFSWALAKRQAWEKKNKKIEKNQKPNPKSFFFDFNWFNYKIQSNWNPKKSEKNRKKNRGKIFFLPSS